MENKMFFKNIEISKIIPDKNQPRKNFEEEAMERLTLSIKENGVEVPITVEKNYEEYNLIDGERRLKACRELNMQEIPCLIVKAPNKLEKQLRTDCLKEGLTVDELDRAIYRYYENCKTSLSVYPQDKGLTLVGKTIGKSPVRVKKAIDRFEFKRDNKEFTEKIERKYNPQKKKFSKVNSTISMTEKIKDPEKRKKTVESILKKRKQKTIETPEIKRIVDRVASGDVKINDVEQITEEKKPDINIVFESWLNRFYDIKSDFELLHFENAIENIDKTNIAKLRRCLENIMTNLTGLEHKFNIKDGKKYGQITE